MVLDYSGPSSSVLMQGRLEKKNRFKIDLTSFDYKPKSNLLSDQKIKPNRHRELINVKGKNGRTYLITAVTAGILLYSLTKDFEITTDIPSSFGRGNTEIHRVIDKEGIYDMIPGIQIPIEKLKVNYDSEKISEVSSIEMIVRNWGNKEYLDMPGGNPKWEVEDFERVIQYEDDLDLICKRFEGIKSNRRHVDKNTMLAILKKETEGKAYDPKNPHLQFNPGGDIGPFQMTKPGAFTFIFDMFYSEFENNDGKTVDYFNKNLRRKYETQIAEMKGFLSTKAKVKPKRINGAINDTVLVDPKKYGISLEDAKDAMWDNMNEYLKQEFKPGDFQISHYMAATYVDYLMNVDSNCSMLFVYGSYNQGPSIISDYKRNGKIRDKKARRYAMKVWTDKLILDALDMVEDNLMLSVKEKEPQMITMTDVYRNAEMYRLSLGAKHINPYSMPVDPSKLKFNY